MLFRALNFDYHAEAVYRAEQRAEASNSPREVILLCEAKVCTSNNLSPRNLENQEVPRDLYVAETQQQDDILAICSSSSSNNNDGVAVAVSKRLQAKKVHEKAADVSLQQDGAISDQTLEQQSSQNDSTRKSSLMHSASTCDANDPTVPRHVIPQRQRHQQQLSWAQVNELWNRVRQNTHVHRITCEPWNESIRSASRSRQPHPLPSLFWSANNRLLNFRRQEKFEQLMSATTSAAGRMDSRLNIAFRPTALVSGKSSSALHLQIQPCLQQLPDERPLLAVVPSKSLSTQGKSIHDAVSTGMKPKKLLQFAAQLVMVAIQQQQQTAQARPDQFEILLDESAYEENSIESRFDNTISSESEKESGIASEKVKFLEKYTAAIQSSISDEEELSNPSPHKRPRFFDRKVTFTSTQDAVSDGLGEQFSMPRNASTSDFDNRSIQTAQAYETARNGVLHEGIFPPRASTTTNSGIAPVNESGATSAGVLPLEKNHAALGSSDLTSDGTHVVDEITKVARKRHREEKRLRRQQKKARKERKKAKKRQKREQSDPGTNASSQQDPHEAKETAMNPFVSLHNPNVAKENTDNPFSNVSTPARPRDVDAVLREAKTSFKRAIAKTEKGSQKTNVTGSGRLPRGTMSSSDQAANPAKTPSNLFARSFKQQKHHVSSRQSSAAQMLHTGRIGSSSHGNNPSSTNQAHLQQATAPASAGMSGHSQKSRQLYGAQMLSVERSSHRRFNTRQGSLQNPPSQYPAQTTLVGHPLQEQEHLQLQQQQQGPRHRSDLPAPELTVQHFSRQQYSAGQSHAENHEQNYQNNVFYVSDSPFQVEKLIDDPSLPPVHLLCSENFLETWGDLVAQLSSGKWTNPKLPRSDPNDDFHHRRKILLHDSDLVDAKNVDIELPNRGAILTFTTSALQEVGPAKEIVVNLARLAANGVYSDVYVCLSYDVWPTEQILRHLAQLENAVIQQNQIPPTRFFFKPASEESLSSIFAEIILSRQRFFTGFHLESTNEFLEDERTREWAWFLAKLLPIISANGAIQCMYLVKAMSPGQSPIGTLFQNDIVRQKIEMSISSVPSRAPEIHPYAMQQLDHLVSVSFHLAGV